MQIKSILIAALGVSALGRVLGISARKDDFHDVAYAGGDPVGVKGRSSGTGLVNQLYRGLFGRHDGEDNGGEAIVSAEHAPIVYVTLSSCLSNVETVVLGSTSDYVIHKPSSTEVRHTVLATDITAVVPTTSIAEHVPSVKTHVPGTTEPQVPVDTLSTIIERTIKTANTCPPDGCLAYKPSTTDVSVPSGPTYPLPVVSGTTSASQNKVITKTTYTTTSEAPASTDGTTTEVEATATPTPSTGEGAGLGHAISPIIAGLLGVLAVVNFAY